ncbi:MAG: hypothetical protein LC131_06735 [Anaerolineae bacterium]|jgi:hypothetical protein|nr:hypothetical protein [Anaerolineae bacterium]GIK44943.1 MAG: hypothetical protein BroJett012_08460 [Betaproteobacteria bacterium]
MQTELSNLQQQVVTRAREMIGQKPWFRGLNLGNLPEDRDIEQEGVENTAVSLAMETAFWDAPDFFNP